MSSSTLQFFRKNLLQWAIENPRPLPWKGERNPYKIWLSEIILQQTRVEQGRAYYERFCTIFPTIQDLAAAPEDAVLKLWEGLGYYTRARNLHKAAKQVVEVHAGIFPKKHADILALPGVGEYTAAAIASFAYDLPHAVVDGNVQRVFARLLGIEEEVDSSVGKKTIKTLADAALDKNRASAYNQAIMDFGATQCVPKSPDCAACPMAKHCVALAKGLVAELPRKKPKAAKVDRYFVYFIVRQGDETWVQQRTEKDIWKNLYEFPLYEAPKERPLPLDWADLVREVLFENAQDVDFSIRSISKIYRQTLSHQYINAQFVLVNLKAKQTDLLTKHIQIKFINIKKMLAFPRIIAWYLEENSDI